MKKIPIDTVQQYWRKHQAQTPDDIFCSLRKLYELYGLTDEEIALVEESVE